MFRFTIRDLALLTTVVATCIALPIAFVLSSGPVCWLYLNGYIDYGTFERIRALHWPIDVVKDHSPHFSDFINWYVRLWQ